MTEPYKFKSSVTKRLLNVGQISINQLTRDEIKNILSNIKETARDEFAKNASVFVECRIKKELYWDVEKMALEAQNLRDDIYALMDGLIVKVKK